jgi:hypothetical protein
VLRVTAHEIGHPVPLVILVVSDDFALQRSLRIAWSERRSGRGFPLKVPWAPTRTIRKTIFSSELSSPECLGEAASTLPP